MASRQVIGRRVREMGGEEERVSEEEDEEEKGEGGHGCGDGLFPPWMTGPAAAVAGL